MSRFVLIPSPFVSHIRVFEALADRLVARGHEVVFLVNEGARPLFVSSAEVRSVRSAGRGGIEAMLARAARPNGPFGILSTVADVSALTDALCLDGPMICRALRPDAVIGDEMEPAAGLLARHLSLPLVSVAAALPMTPAPGIPLPFLDWPFDPSPEGLKRNEGGVTVARVLLSRQRRTIARWAERFGLPRLETAEDCLSSVLRIAQTVPGFDFPRPAQSIFHAVGPIRGEEPLAPVLPFAFDPARPLVFASFGTMQGHRRGLFSKVVRAARSLGCQTLVAHCGRLSERDAKTLGADFVTDFAPLGEVMRHAALCVTHGGMNTTMDALRVGVPVLAVPIAFDQPGVAARIAYHRVGERLPRVMVSARRIASSMERLLERREIRENAGRIGREIQGSGGAELAVDLIERVAGVDAYRRQAALA